MAKLNSLQPKIKTLGKSQTKKPNWGRGSTWQWRKTRQKVIERDKYTCQSCGTVTLKPEVDHIVNRAVGGTDELSNLQVLCSACHKIKTHKESQGGGYQKV